MATASDPTIDIETSADNLPNTELEQAVPFITNRWSTKVIQPFLMALLATSLLTALVNFMQFIIQDQPLLRVVPLFFLFTLEGIYTHRWLSRPNQRMLNRVAYRAAEMVLIFLSARLYTWIAFGNWPSMTLFLDYLKSPGLLLFDGHMIFTLVTTFIAWGMGLGYANLFADLAITEVEAIHFSTPKKKRSEDNKPFQLDRTGLVNLFFVQWLWGGVVMLLLTAMSTIDLPNAVRDFTLNVTHLGLQPALFWALILYFMSGFLLLSQGRLTAQTARWLRAGATKSLEIERSWYRNSLRLVLIIAFVTAFIPIGSTTPISRLLINLLAIVTAIFTAFLALIGALISLLFPNSGEQTEFMPALEPAPVQPPVPTAVPDAVPPNEVVQYIFSSAFWALIIVVVIIALTFFMRERGIKLNRATLRAAWQKLILFLTTGWGRVSEQVAAIQHALTSRNRADEEAGNGRSNPFQFIRVNGLLPREQIKYFYLSTLRRIEDKGIERGNSITPSEFVETLKEQFPEAENEVETLTEAFLKARYSKKEIKVDEINPIKKRWKKMRSNIRRKKSS